jgi:hypothetical protein
MITTKEDYKNVIFSGCSLEYRGLSICNLATHYKRVVSSNEYQVWYNKDKEYHLFKNVDEAVDKFLEIKNRIDSRRI